MNLTGFAELPDWQAIHGPQTRTDSVNAQRRRRFRLPVGPSLFPFMWTVVSAGPRTGSSRLSRQMTARPKTAFSSATAMSAFCCPVAHKPTLLCPFQERRLAERHAGDGFASWDIPVKRWKVPRENHSLQFRWEVFQRVRTSRAFNAPRRGLIAATSLRSNRAAFGAYTHPAYEPRVMQSRCATTSYSALRLAFEGAHMSQRWISSKYLCGLSWRVVPRASSINSSINSPEGNAAGFPPTVSRGVKAHCCQVLYRYLRNGLRCAEDSVCRTSCSL